MRRSTTPTPARRASIGSVGDAYDNALAETTVGLYKTECIRHSSPFRSGPIRTLADLEEITSAWVHWYNTSRLMHRLGRRPPGEAEANYYAHPWWRPAGRSHVQEGCIEPGTIQVTIRAPPRRDTAIGVIQYKRWGVDLVGLWRYPVKSLQGERLKSASFEDGGMAGDREWGIRDERTGRILTARRRPELLAAAACYDDDLPAITLPDGRTAVGPGSDTDHLLSVWLEGPVSLLSSSVIAGGKAEYFADATDDNSEAIEWTMPIGRYVDASPVLVLTTASLRTAARFHPDGVWDTRRFRPNLLIDVDGEGWLEDQWIGQPLQIDGVTLMPRQPCIRCTMVTRAQPGLDADVEVFRTLARHHHGHFGVWSDVLEAGWLSVGNQARVGARRPLG